MHNTITLQIPIYAPENGLKLEWEKDFLIKITQSDGCILLSANANGLKSLAKHLLCLADAEVPMHHHIHLDESNSLEERSIELIIEKI